MGEGGGRGNNDGDDDENDDDERDDEVWDAEASMWRREGGLHSLP